VPVASLSVTSGHLAELASHAFAYVGLALASKSAQSGLAHEILQRQARAELVEIGGTTFRVAPFEHIAADLTPLRNLIAMIGDLKTAIVYVRGRYYPPGQHTRLYQWLTCYQRMQGMSLPAVACDYCVRGDRPLTLPCSLLGSFHAYGAPDTDAAPYFAAAAARDGLDRCPRFRVTR
jgi:hypothetical protein